MKLTTFLKRPVLSCVISVLIVMLGVMGFLSLPVEQYPDIAPPTIEVSTSFYGADAQTIIKSVITPLEEAINGVENMIYMSSSASNNGEATISVVFKQGTNPDMAAVNVQNRVQRASSLLPAEVKQVGVTVEKSQNSMLQIFSIYSPDDAYDFKFLSNYASINIKPRIMLVNGVGKFQMLGSDYSLRVWMDPASMAQHDLTPEDVSLALMSQNMEAATGTFGENSDESYQYKLKYTGRLKDLSEFENIVIRSQSNGNVLRLADVAKVELGSESYAFTGTTNGHPGVMCIAYQAAGSNATQVNREINETLKVIKKEAPSGIEIATLLDTNDFLYASIKQVAGTLRDAIILVVLIVLLFLKDFRSTLIPFISIMVSLIGTFAFMMVAGFSINLLTLFALVLVIGTVVDDSIVVVEAVHSKFEEGITSPFQATEEAVKEIAAPVITSSLVFMAVFIPVSLLGGTSGIFYRQFGLTMAVAVGISAINALTTVPALCALILKPIKKPQPGDKLTFKQKYSRWFDGLMAKFIKGYGNGLNGTISRKPVIWILAAGAFVLLVFCMKTMPKGLVPEEDKGLLIVEVTNPPGTSLNSTDAVARQISEEIMKLEGIADISTTSGYGFISGANSASACIICRLDNWKDRDKEHTQNKIAANIQELCDAYKDVNAMVFTTPMIPGYGTSSGIEMYVQDRRGGSVEELYEVTRRYLESLAPEGVYGFMSFNMDYPQWEVSVDVPKAVRNGVSPKDVLGTMGTYYGGAYINDVNLYSKVYKVMIQGDPESRRDESSLDRTFVRTAGGGMAPLSNFVSIRRVYGPDAIKNFNKFTAINVSVASLKSTGECLEILKKSADKNLPEGYSIDFAGMSREQSNQGGLEIMLLICTFLIYLILAALYESVVIPFAAILAVPVGLAGSYGISLLFGLDNNIYLQTGVIMLIGLLSKTAILITEYAVLRHKNGLSVDEAAVEAGKARLRPILMTAGTMIIGLLPMITSINGVGGMGNFSLGLGAIVGMTIGTIALLFVTPVTFTAFQKIQDKIKPMLVIFLCVMATSCSALGKYKPETGVADNIWGEEVPAADSASSFALMGWKNVFTDPCLQNLIDSALVRNLDLKVAMEHVRQAEAQLSGARLAYVPTLAVNPGFSASYSGIGSAENRSHSDYSIPAASSWQLGIFRLTNNLKSARANVARSEDYYAAARAGLIAGVANTYYTILMLDAQLATSRDILAAWEKSVETVKSLMDVGLADQVAVSQYVANRENIEINIASLENQLEITLNSMCLLLAQTPDYPIARSGMDAQVPPASIEAGVPVQLLSLRPDVRAAQRDMELAHYAARGALLNFFPALSINGSLGLVNPADGSLSPMSLLGSVGTSLTVPILNAGANRSAYRSALSRQRESRLVFDRTLLAAGKEVNDAFARYNSSKKMASHYTARVEALDKARKDTEYLMSNSLDKTYLDVLFAYTGFFDAKLQMIANQAQMYQSLLSIYVSLGGC